jgi:galactoside O-acetyltransferase
MPDLTLEQLKKLPLYTVERAGSKTFVSREQRASLTEVLGYEAWAWYQSFWYWIPGRLGWILRRLAYGPFLKKAGKNFHIAEFTSIQPPHMLELGEHAAISRYCIINARGGVKIGNYAGCGPMCQIISYSHRMYAEDDAKHPLDRGFESAPIVFEDDVWVGAHCTIMMGVTLHRGSIIGAGSVVTSDIPPYVIAAGAPARPIMLRKPAEEIMALIEVEKQKAMGGA